MDGINGQMPSIERQNAMGNAAELIRRYNAGRDPERLALKLKKMWADPFAFLRGSCHLFYDRLPQFNIGVEFPVVWLCGDLHLENFGGYKGDDRSVCFDINDFDESALGPASFDLARWLTSLRVSAADLDLKAADVDVLCHAYLSAYAETLALAKSPRMDADNADGVVRDLLNDLQKRKRPEFLDTRTERTGKSRRIRIDGRKALNVDQKQRGVVEAFLHGFAATKSNPDFFRVLDVARRISGTGSLGVERYVVLIEGKGSPDGNYLLDIKKALPSALAPYLHVSQPAWTAEAERVVFVQQHMQAVSMAFLDAVKIDGDSFVLRGLQPHEDRVDLTALTGKPRHLKLLVKSTGELTARAQLRSSGWRGAAAVDALIAFGQRKDWQEPLLECSINCTLATQNDWNDFRAACDKGAFN